MKKYQVLVLALSLAAVPAGLAQGCCAKPMAGCPMMGAQTVTNATSAPHAVAAQPANPEAAKAVFDNYIAIQTALSQDAFSDIPEKAGALAQAVQGDQSKSFPSLISKQSEALSKASDIAAAREIFKSLSQSLIGYVTTRKNPVGTLYEVYCPMAKANWLQSDKTVTNPYMGQSMPQCGQLARSYQGAVVSHAEHTGH